VNNPPPDDEPEPEPPTGPTGPRPRPGFEAARAKVVGATKIRAKLFHTGGGFVELGGTGQGVAWQLNAAKAGTYSLILRYAHGETTAQPINILGASGVKIGQLLLKPTGSWHFWKTARVRVELPAGLSDVQFVLQSTEGIVHVDSLRHNRLTLEAETATPTGGASAVTNPPLPDGLGLVHLRGRSTRSAGKPVSLEWTINAATAGDYDLHVRYANLSANVLNVELLDVTTGTTTNLALPRTSGWSSLSYASVTVNLSGGTHKLRLTSSVQSPVVIDSLMVSPPIS
jgi:hypothetical protein